ncbi:MAG: hypothetical protein K6F30_05020 [Lachnospiraceae bacterium]|nr:hypothetical protein [Lachnospiraceae bacterium]
MKKEKTNLYFMMFLILFGAVLSYRYFDQGVSRYNTTLFALSYKYGPISRGLLGTLYAGLNHILPMNLMSYSWVYFFCLLSTAFFDFLLLIFFTRVLQKSVENQKNQIYLILLVAIFTFPMFVTKEMLGRLDIYLMILVMLCLFCLIEDRCLWLIPVFCVVAMLFHQGFVFTNINLILVLLFYKGLKEDGNRKYFVVFGITLLLCSVLFLYFEFFSHSNGSEILDEVVTNAKALSASGRGYNPSIIDHEILGKDVYEAETEYRVLAHQETGVFLVFFWPFLILGFGFMKHLLQGQKGKNFLAYLGICLGGFTMIPEILLKVDFGRYAYYTFWYYLVAAMVLILWKDEVCIQALEWVKSLIKKWLPIPQLVFAYLLLFVPFHDIIYGELVDNIKIFIFG